MTIDRLKDLLGPYLDASCFREAAHRESLYTRLLAYLDLLLRWNERTNLTAIRDPDEMVTRHFGESLYAAGLLQSLCPEHGSLLDLGSGAGFPGLPIQLAKSNLRVTLAESQGKKAAFLREAVRLLSVRTEVWGVRAETMPRERTFDVVTLRAVDRMQHAFAEAEQRIGPFGHILELAGDEARSTSGLELLATYPIPASSQRVIRIWKGRR